MGIWYQYDSVEKDVLIRYVEDNQFHEILHKGDKAWRALYPQPNDNDELYTRAIWLGEGCWECLDDITEQEAEKILKDWGYDEMPPGDPEAVNGIAVENRDREELPIFCGTLKKIRIDSNNVCYGPCPLEDEETEQHLTINDQGRVWLTRLAFGGKTIERKNFKIDAKVARNLLNAYRERFSQERDIYFVTDIGCWEMIFTNEEGRKFRYRGSLTEEAGTAVKGLSEMTRLATGRDDLFVFDGCPDRIDTLKVEYERETRIKPKGLPEGTACDYATWNYSEILTIDRATETLTNHIQFADQCSVTNTYHVEDGISSLLDELWPKMFDDVPGNPPDVIDDPVNQQKYKITVITKHGDEKVVEGSFDKLGLPEEYPEFIEKIYDFMSFYGIGELFERSSYERTKRRTSDYIFCDVEFEAGGKTYCYLADDDSYEVNDTVLVPAGPDNHEALVRIVAKNYYSAEDAPFPVDKAKHIIKRIDEDEIEEYLIMD